MVKLKRFFTLPFNRFDYLIAFILALVTLILCVRQISDGHNWGGDFGGYIAQAIALVNGTTAQYIADNTLMMTKCDYLIGPYAYPWGFPALLAIAYKIFGFNIVAFKGVGIICYTLFVGIFYIFCAIRLPRIYAIFATLIFVINPYMTNFAINEIFSDIPFMLFGFIALIILAKLFGESQSNNNGILIAIFGGIFMLFATMIRINGFVILCALLTMHGILLAKRFAPNLFAIKILKPFSHIDSPYFWKIHTIPYIIFVIGFALISITFSSGGSGHWQHLANTSLQRILHNLDFYIYAIATFKDFLMIDIKVKPIVFVLSIFLYYIALRSILNDNRFAENVFYIIFSLGFFILLIIWIDIMWLRFAYLLLPFLVFGCAKGLAYLNANNKIFGRIINMLLLIIVVSSAYNILQPNNGFIKNMSYTKEAIEIWDFIDKNTPKNAVILFHKPRVLYLNAHRISFASNNIARFDEVDFVLWERGLWKFYKGVDIDSNAFKERTELIYQNAQFKLFAVKKPSY